MSNRNEYEQKLLHCASELDDAMKNNGGIIQLALSIIQAKDDKTAVQLCAIIGKVADQGNPNSEGDIDNCQSAAVAFYARLLGMKATAKKYADGGDLW